MEENGVDARSAKQKRGGERQGRILASPALTVHLMTGTAGIHTVLGHRAAT